MSGVVDDNWLVHQMDLVKKEVEKWPDWMKEVSVSQNYGKESDCLIEKFISSLPVEDRFKPYGISCPCKRCSPHSM